MTGKLPLLLLLTMIVVCLGLIVVDRYKNQTPSWAHCPRPWVPLVYGDGHIAGAVCYKKDGTTRTILFR